MSRRPGDRVIHRQRASRPALDSADGWRLRSAIRIPSPDSAQTVRSSGLRYGGTLLAVAATTALLLPIRETAGLLNIGFVFLVVIIGATIFAGRWAGVFAGIAGFLFFDYFLVPPYNTFAVTDFRNVLALFVFLGVSLLISWLISEAREQARQAQRRAADVTRLYELSQAIIGGPKLEEILQAIARKVYEVFEAQACWILLPDSQQQLEVRAQAPDNARPMTRDELSLARWAFWHGSDIGKSGTDRFRNGEGFGLSTLRTARSEQARAAFVPLRANDRTIGVLAVADRRDHRPFTAEERTVIATFADQAAVALDRLSLLREAQRAEVLARTDELKSALMSAVSHDLKTPIASIMASVTSLLEKDIHWDEETQRDFLQGIYDEARRLNRLVSNLLDMSRIEGGALHPEKNWYSIEEVVHSVVQRLEPRMAGHTVTVDLETSLPLALFDYTEIDQVLTNLVENALKYTPSGSTILISARRVDDYLEVRVEDNGPGVSSEHLGRLFDKFYRAGQRKGTSGTGLGLAIAKGFIEAHGGTIRATNRPEGGLRVSFTLPLSTLPTSTPGVKDVAPSIASSP
jgi:two-component system sensor histidine kinase KdpD